MAVLLFTPFRNYRRTLNLCLLLLIAACLVAMLWRQTLDPPSAASDPRKAASATSASAPGLNLPPFLTAGRASREQDKMDAVKEASCHSLLGLYPIIISSTQMMRHAWSGYVQYAWGADDLNPVSMTPHIWYSNYSLLNTPVDALDTLLIMGMNEEYAAARDLVFERLDFSAINTQVSLFETTIRILGGLLSAYDLSGDRRLVEKAVELADRLLPAFNTPTGIPVNFINLATGDVGKSIFYGILSEFGSLQLEFQYLSDVTGNPIYAQKALYVYDQMHSVEFKIPGLYPELFSNEKLETNGVKVALGGRSDSYYEYLLKLWLSTGEQKYYDLYYRAAEAIVEYMVVQADAGHLYIPAGYVQYTNESLSLIHEDLFEHLTCFSGGMFATGALASRKGNWTHHLYVGAEITDTCWKMYNQSATGIGSENANGESLRLMYSTYILRPEAVESLFYMWRFTHDQIYRDRAWVILQNLQTYCRNEVGFHGLSNANSINGFPVDRQESFFLAETLKYLYLIFADDDVVPLEKYVFNTEAHPLSVRGHGKRNDPSRFTPMPPQYETPVGVLKAKQNED